MSEQSLCETEATAEPGTHMTNRNSRNSKAVVHHCHHGPFDFQFSTEDRTHGSHMLGQCSTTEHTQSSGVQFKAQQKQCDLACRYPIEHSRTEEM